MLTKDGRLNEEDKPDFRKISCFCFSRDNVTKMKRQAAHLENICKTRNR